MDGDARQWLGDVPVYLIVNDHGLDTVIDLDEPKWPEKHASLLERGKTTWHLFRKDGGYLFTMLLREGESGFCVRRHIARGLGASPGAQVTAYGLGKLRRDGQEHSIWWFPDGQICFGDDVYDIGTSKNIATMERRASAI